MKYIISILLMFISLKLSAPNINWLPIERSEGLKDPFVVLYTPLIWSINMTEARIDTLRFNKLAYNRFSKATGPFQITPIRLADYNKKTGSHYKLRDCFDYEISLKIFRFYIDGKDFKSAAYDWYGNDKNTWLYWKEVQKFIIIFYRNELLIRKYFYL